MASIYPNRKKGKIVSFKFKAFIGREANGKQLFKCTTWLPEKSMSESKLIAQAEKEVIIWEKQLIDEISLQKQKLSPSEITLNEFDC